MQYIHANHALTPDGWVRDVQIEIDAAGRIAQVGRQSAPPSQRLDLALPAAVNLHSHAFQRAMAGLTETRGPDPGDNFWSWRRLMYRFLDRLTPDHVGTIAALVYMEMLEAGYAGVAEFHYLHHATGGVPYSNLAEMAERIVAAACDTGIGLTLLPVLYQFGGCDQRPLTAGQKRFGNDPDRFAQLLECSRTAVRRGHADYLNGVAPHSLRAVNQAGLEAALAFSPHGAVHMHLAEQVAEVAEFEAFSGSRPAEWLLNRVPLDERWCLIHCTQMTEDETVRLARTGAVAGLCPITESNLGDGIFNGTTYLGAQGTIGFGSDSNVQITLFDELKTLEYSQRLRDRGRAVLAAQDRSTGRVLYDMATRGGAQAAARNSGMIAPGKLADIVGLATDNQWLCNRTGDVVLDSAIFGGHGQRCVTDVWAAGRHVVQEGRHIHREAIITGFNATIADLGQDI